MNSFATCPFCLTAGLAALLMTGCLNTKPASDPTRYYVLSAPAPVAANGGGQTAGMAVGLNPVTLPAYLMDKRLAVRKGSSEIVYLEFHRWSERLESAVERVLAQNLESQTNIGRIHAAPWRRNLVQLELSVSFTQCDLTESGRVILNARWHSGKPGVAEGQRTGKAQVQRDGPPAANDPQGAVAALSAALAEMSVRIAGDITRDR